MKKNIVLLFFLFLGGCVSVEFGATSKTAGIHGDPNKNILTNIDRVYAGMTQKEVVDIMGDRTVIGYEKMGAHSEADPVFLKSPYRTEILKDQDKSYEVMYYFTHIKKADGIISEEELTPLVLEDNKLIGKGQDFLFKLKNTLN